MNIDEWINKRKLCKNKVINYNIKCEVSEKQDVIILFSENDCSKCNINTRKEMKI